MAIKKLVLAGVIAAMTSPVIANETNETEHLVDITWENPKDFTDLKPANGVRKKFRDNTLAKLQTYMDKLATSLPEGQQLKMTVTDVDLAGQVWPGHFVGFNAGSDVRIVKRVYIPRIEFSYQLVDDQGNVIKSGEEHLKDMSFLDRSTAGLRRHDTLRYEKRMLKDWFRDEFDLLASNNKD